MYLKITNTVGFAFQFLMAFMLIFFAFGESVDFRRRPIESASSIFSLYKSVLVDIRFLLPLIVVGLLLLYRMSKRRYPHFDPIVHIIALIHFSLALKQSIYLNEIYWKGFINIPTIYLIAVFCQITVNITPQSSLKKVVLSATIITLMITFSMVDLSTIIVTENRYQFQYGNPNHAGVGLASLLILFLSINNTDVTSSRVLELILLTMMVLAVLLTGSRTALTGIIVFVALKYLKLRVWSAGLLLIGLGVSLIYYSRSQVWEGRSDRSLLWENAFSRSDYTLIYGANFKSQEAFIEGFFVSLPYALGILGIILLMLFVGYFLLTISKSKAILEGGKNMESLFPFLVAFGWMAIFESILFGVLTQPIVAFFTVIALCRKRCNN
ncbi:hypothetical protein ACFL3Y_01805 [Pseudomonadota bacterium]